MSHNLHCFLLSQLLMNVFIVRRCHSGMCFKYFDKIRSITVSDFLTRFFYGKIFIHQQFFGIFHAQVYQVTDIVQQYINIAASKEREILFATDEYICLTYSVLRLHYYRKVHCEFESFMLYICGFIFDRMVKVVKRPCVGCVRLDYFLYSIRVRLPKKKTARIIEITDKIPSKIDCVSPYNPLY